jgi:ribosomal protein S18 acetylase RimI-like enzyme
MTRPEKIEVRVAPAADAATFGRLLHKFNLEFDEETPDPDVIAERAAPLMASGEMAVLFVGEAPDGFSQLRFRSSLCRAARGACLDELYVVPERRRNGLGRALLEAAMEHARARGADHIELNTSEADTAALNLYESPGFSNREGSPSGPRMLYFERDL